MSDPQHTPGILRRIPQSPWVAVFCGVLVALPTMSAGLFMDDVLARVKLLGIETPWSPAPWWDLYTFGREDLNQGLLDAGHHPWWGDPSMKMTFFRPLSALTHHLDYWIWPNSPALQHLHSVLWYGLVVALAAMLFRRLHGQGTITIVAALSFALAAPHIMTLGWLAGRNTLLSCVAGILVVLAHRAWREAENWKYLAGSVLALIVGLLSGEAALGALGYLVAWCFFMERSPWKTRLCTLLPYGTVVMIWRVLYVRAGFGTSGTSIYHDPATDLADFLQALVLHLPVLMLGRWTMAPLDFWSVIPTSTHIYIAGMGLFLSAMLGWLLWPVLRRHKEGRFWATGMVLSLLPFCATVPMDRLTLFAGLGFAGLLGLFSEEPLTKLKTRRIRTALLVFYLPISALFGIARASTLSLNLAPNTDGYHQAPRDTSVPNQTFVYVSGTFHRTHYTTLMREAAGDIPTPRRSVVLTSMMTPSKITRTDKNTLEIVPEGGFMALGLDRIHRRLQKPFSKGQKIELPDLTVEVLDLTPDGRPAKASFRFKTPLESPSLRWLAVVPGQGPLDFDTIPFSLPAQGTSIDLRGGL